MGAQSCSSAAPVESRSRNASIDCTLKAGTTPSMYGSTQTRYQAITADAREQRPGGESGGEAQRQKDPACVNVIKPRQRGEQEGQDRHVDEGDFRALAVQRSDLIGQDSFAGQIVGLEKVAEENGR